MCTHDEMNWDWTIQYSFQHIMESPVKIIFPNVGRVKHIGLWLELLFGFIYSLKCDIFLIILFVFQI